MEKYRIMGTAIWASKFSMHMWFRYLLYQFAFCLDELVQLTTNQSSEIQTFLYGWDGIEQSTIRWRNPDLKLLLSNYY